MLKMKLLLVVLLSFLVSGFRCADIPEDIWDLLKETEKNTENGVENVSVLTKRLYSSDSTTTFSPSLSTEAGSEDSSLPKKKQKFLRVKTASVNEISLAERVIAAYSADVFDLKVLENEFWDLEDQRQKQKFVHHLLMIKYSEVVPDAVNKITWSLVDMVGWPEGLQSLTVRFLNSEECLKILRGINEIHFGLKKAVKIQKKGNRKLNDALYSTLRESCKSCGLIIKPKSINWKLIYEKVPKFTLKTQDYRVWTGDDREQIQKHLLDDLIPRLKQEQQERQGKE